MKLLHAALLAALMVTPFAVHAAEETGADDKGPFKMRLDTDGDGLVSKAEFMKAQEERFADMDTNGDGSVSGDEMKASWDRWKERRAEMRGKAKDKPAATPAE